jgi:hypothetical protein
VDRLAKVGADPSDDPDVRQRKGLLVLIAVLVLPISFLRAGLYLSFGAWSGSMALLYAAISIGSIALFARNGNSPCCCGPALGHTVGLTYSPLSRVLELETLMSTIRGKQSLWATLHTAAPSHPEWSDRDFALLKRRGSQQLESLERVMNGRSLR